MIWVLIVIGAVIGVYVLCIVIGAVSPQKSGKAYLKKELIKKGIPQDILSDAFLADVVADARQLSEMTYRNIGREGRNTYFIAALNGYANSIFIFYTDPPKEGTRSSNVCFSLMRQHGII